MGHITVGTEHLLMGILSCGKSDAADLLARYDVNFICVYNVALNVLGCGQPTKLGEEDFSTNAIDVLKDAYGKAIHFVFETSPYSISFIPAYPFPF